MYLSIGTKVRVKTSDGFNGCEGEIEHVIPSHIGTDAQRYRVKSSHPSAGSGLYWFGIHEVEAI